MKQQELIPKKHFQTSFGGSLMRSNPKAARPLQFSKSLHLVLKSSQAVGDLSFLEHQKEIAAIVKKQAKKQHVRIYQWQNVGNHLHFVIKVKTRETYRAFVRSLTGLIARLITGVQKGFVLKRKFWDYRPFTRVIEWGSDFFKMKYYLKKNNYQAKGFSEAQSRYLLEIDSLWRKLCSSLE